MSAKLVSICMAIALGACSFAFQPKRTLDPRRPQPSGTPILLDGAIATGLLAVGISETGRTCSESQWLCLSSIDHAVGGVAIGLAAVYALSALYGYGRYAGAADTSSRDLAEHVSIAAHSGDCATAASAAAQLHAADQAAYEGLLDDAVVQRCLLRASDDERRAVLDAIAHAPDRIPLAAPPGAPSSRP